jgi:death on curing protein
VTAWRWVGLAAVHAIHDRQLAEHGGLPGVRDFGAIESALARPQNLAAYGEPDAADLAAAYAYGLARNHGFADGNKRTAWVVARVFLADNGYRLWFEPTEAVGRGGRRRHLGRWGAGSLVPRPPRGALNRDPATASPPAGTA